MATMDEWAAFFSGDYMGWARQPQGGDWEDLIGLVRLECAAGTEGCLDVTITSLEFGTWIGSVRLRDGVMEGSTGQGGASFRCAFQERGPADGIQGCFSGGIYSRRAKLLLELRFTSDWRRRRPEQR